jgi:hypothetical protein
MKFSTTWRRVRVRNGGQVIEMLPAVADAMVAGGTAQYVDDKGRVTDIDGNLLEKRSNVETAAVSNHGSEKAAFVKPHDRPRRQN